LGLVGGGDFLVEIVEGLVILGFDGREGAGKETDDSDLAGDGG
jgi:hypothetical protein